MQYFNYFNDYIKGTKGEELNFVFKRHPKGIEWEIELDNTLPIEEIKEYLIEYVEYLVNKDTEIRSQITRPIVHENEIKILELKHNQQISHLEQQIQIYKVENNILNDNLNYFKTLLAGILTTNHLEINSKFNYEEIKGRIAKGEINEVINFLLTDKDFDNFNNELILHKENHMDLRRKIRVGLISHEEAQLIKNRIQSSLLEIINFKKNAI